MSQDEGLGGKFVGGMIRRNVRSRFRRVSWVPFDLPAPPIVFLANHHGWHDGYLLHEVLGELHREFLLWIEEFDAFPLFGKSGAVRFPKGDSMARASAIRQTIKQMKSGEKSLILFPEGELHHPPEIWEFGPGLELIQKHVPNATVLLTSIVYEMSVHERPEAYVQFGDPDDSCLREQLQWQTDALRNSISAESKKFEVLIEGTPDVNERWDMRKPRGKK